MKLVVEKMVVNFMMLYLQMIRRTRPPYFFSFCRIEYKEIKCGFAFAYGFVSNT